MDAIKLMTEGMLKAEKPEVNVGDTVKKGQVVCIIEAMKLENEVVSSSDGVVTAITATKGATVANKDELIVLG